MALVCCKQMDCSEQAFVHLVDRPFHRLLLAESITLVEVLVETSSTDCFGVVRRFARMQ